MRDVLGEIGLARSYGGNAWEDSSYHDARVSCVDPPITRRKFPRFVKPQAMSRRSQNLDLLTVQLNRVIPHFIQLT